MPAQTVGNVHVDALLSNLARLYRPLDEGFIADLVAPYLPVVHESDKYVVWDQGPFFSTEVDDLTPDRQEPRIVEFSHSTESYVAQRRELAWDISDRERGNSDNQLRLQENKQAGTLGLLMLKREQRVADMLRKVANGGQLNLGANAATKWDNAAADYQDLAIDVMAGKTALRQAVGANPNVIVIPSAVAEGMHKSLLFQVLQYTYGDSRARNLIEQEYPVLPGQLFGMKVIVGGQIKNTAVEGQTASYSDVWGEAVRLLYVSTRPATETPSVAYTFRSEPLTTRRDRLERRRVDWFATGQTIVEKVVAPDAGYEIADCLT